MIQTYLCYKENILKGTISWFNFKFWFKYELILVPIFSIKHIACYEFWISFSRFKCRKNYKHNIGRDLVNFNFELIFLLLFHLLFIIFFLYIIKLVNINLKFESHDLKLYQSMSLNKPKIKFKSKLT